MLLGMPLEWCGTPLETSLPCSDIAIINRKIALKVGHLQLVPVSCLSLIVICGTCIMQGVPAVQMRLAHSITRPLQQDQSLQFDG